MARHSLDGILDVWDQCRHWSIHEGDHLKAVDIHDLLKSHFPGAEQQEPEKDLVVCTQDQVEHKVAGSSPARDKTLSPSERLSNQR